VTIGSKHHAATLPAKQPATGEGRLPCGCTAFLSDGNPNTLHQAGCKMNRVLADHRAVVRQRPAVIAMFTQLNELWYLSHVRFVPNGTKRCDRPERP
jgi:hypothetical protein